jgi:hypothetical protein
MSNSDLPPDATGRLVLVFAAPSIPEGLLAKGLLESDGIPVVTKGESEGPYRIGPVFLWVPEAFEVQARVLLADVEREARSAEASSMWAEPDDEPAEETEPGPS